MPARRVTTFTDNIDSYRSELAVIDHDGRAVTYGELLDRADRFGGKIGSVPRLVFLETDNRLDSLAAYVACIRGRHPVYLYTMKGPHDREKRDALVDRYRPNVVICQETSGAIVNRASDDLHDLHPELGVLASTSGSTGSAKLVKLSRRNVDANSRAIATYLELTTSERAMMSLPLNYSYGMSVVNSHFGCGAAVVLTNASVTDPEFWQAFRQAGATSFAGVPHTFESLERSRFGFDDVPTLNYATQAGGRLDPSLVEYFANLSALQGWRFVVMYGQTEAAPRIAYLPPELAAEYPGCIGVAIPGGRISLVDDHGNEIRAAGVPGELVYSGPNVMMGYAESPADLATNQTPKQLATGDIACRNAAGLIHIVGRTKRFVKPFGLRINLDEIESLLQKDLPGARCAGDDRRIVIAIEARMRAKGAAAIARLAASMSLPAFLFGVIELSPMPQLANGKVDYARILAAGAGETPASVAAPPGPLAAARLVFSRRFLQLFSDEAASLIGLRQRRWTGVRQIYQTLLESPTVKDNDSFRTLAGDSLSYVQVTAALSDYLGALPPTWAERTVEELETLRAENHARAV